MNRFRCLDNDSELAPIFDRHHFGTIIAMSPESLSRSLRNAYRHRPESAVPELYLCPLFAFADLPAIFGGLFVGHPSWIGVTVFHSHGEQVQSIAAAVRFA